MTETSILPISSGNAQPPSGDDASSDEGGLAGANRRKLLIAGGVTGVAVVAVAAFMLLHGGSSTPSASTSAVPHGTFTHAATAPSGSSTGGGGATTKLPRKSKAQAGRDPFNALFVAPLASGTQVGSTTVVSPAPSAVPTAPVTVPPVSTAPTTPPTTTPPAALGSPTFLQLVSTHGVKSATFKVGYHHNTFKRFVVLAPKSSSSTGTVFGTEFSLIGVQNGQVTVQIGDDSPFDLSKGVERRLR
jgi:hypothetical protein